MTQLPEKPKSDSKAAVTESKVVASGLRYRTSDGDPLMNREMAETGHRFTS